MRDNIIKAAFQIFTLKQKTNFIFFSFFNLFFVSFLKCWEFCNSSITAILFDIQEAAKYDNFYNFFTIIQNYFGGNFKIITIFILILVFTIKFIFFFLLNILRLNF